MSEKRPVRFASVGDPAIRDNVLAIIASQGHATNSLVRATLGIGYDEAIAVFNWLLSEGAIVRTGSAGGTRYVLPPREQ